MRIQMEIQSGSVPQNLKAIHRRPCVLKAIQILWFNCIKSIFHQPTEFIRAQYTHIMRHYDDYNYNLENQEEPDHEAYEQKLYEEARDEALEIQYQERLDFIEAMKDYYSEGEFCFDVEYALGLSNS